MDERITSAPSSIFRVQSLDAVKLVDDSALAHGSHPGAGDA
jgi:hypothetical protein